MDQPIQVSEPNHYFHDCPAQTQFSYVQQCGHDHCGHELEWRWANDPSWYYTIDEIIAMLSIMTDSMFSISTKASSYGCIWIQSPHTIDYTNAPDIREILGLEGRTVILPASFYESNVIDITRNRQVILVYSSLDPSADLKIANHSNNLLTTLIIDDPTTNYCRLMEDICLPMITRFDRLIFVFKDLSDFKHRVFRQINAKNSHLARNVKCRFCDFFGSQRAVQNHEV